MSATPVEMAEAQDFPKSAFVVLLEDYRALERQLAEALKLLDAVNATQWSGIECSDVDGANWFNACDKFTAALKANLDPGRPGTPHRSGGGHPVGPWPMFASPAPADIPHYKFGNVTCSQCGGEFGPGNHGFSHCENHKHLLRIG